ncbi:divergent PAP2 family protein [Clostridium sp. MSJ-4]|uniref:Divergent PAP2 family protein n=1 Tax=Clostridium simiarum TaxID=2841506 RepID=A0ABS6F2G1_9CLOT|nr:divergent PAP2 family protein [Clostridium simiarum]MBU5592707.1 divergent PAP2 family protein [Clostridium simiarum]
MDNSLLSCAVIAWLTAQIIKVIMDAVLSKRLKIERIVGSGGMPSSHSALVAALATASALQYGINSFQFSLTDVLAAIVMYDASGVRRATGEKAKILNQMIENFEKTSCSPFSEKRLKELVVHTPLHVETCVLLQRKIVITN